MPAPTPSELAQMLANMGGNMTEPMTLEVEEPLKLDLQDQVIPHNAWQPLEEEITEVEVGKLVDALITYINKMDFPPRFKTPLQAYAYFGIMSEAQIARLNEIADKLANPPVEETLPEEEPAA